MHVIDILGLDKFDNVLTVGMRLDSQRLGSKDIIKIEHRTLTKEELDKISIVAPNATINIIKDHKKVDKFQVELPREIHNIVKCSNTNCITHQEPIGSRVLHNEGTFTCYYCESTATQDQLELL